MSNFAQQLYNNLTPSEKFAFYRHEWSLAKILPRDIWNEVWQMTKSWVENPDSR